MTWHESQMTQEEEREEGEKRINRLIFYINILLKNKSQKKISLITHQIKYLEWMTMVKRDFYSSKRIFVIFFVRFASMILPRLVAFMLGSRLLMCFSLCPERIFCRSLGPTETYASTSRSGPVDDMQLFIFQKRHFINKQLCQQLVANRQLFYNITYLWTLPSPFACPR